MEHPEKVIKLRYEFETHVSTLLESRFVSHDPTAHGWVSDDVKCQMALTKADNNQVLSIDVLQDDLPFFGSEDALAVLLKLGYLQLLDGDGEVRLPAELFIGERRHSDILNGLDESHFDLWGDGDMHSSKEKGISYDPDDPDNHIPF